MKIELNDRFLRSLKPDPDKRLEVSDTKCVGLRFRLSSHGHASWIYQKRIKGKGKRTHTLGAWPKPVSLSQARALGFQLQAEAARGIDRVEVAKEERAKAEVERAQAVSCREVLNNYRDLHLSTIRTGDERYRQISTALAQLMDVPFSKITRRDIQAAVDRKAQEGRRPYANRIRAALIAFANWAFLRGYADEPIGAGIGKATKERARDRVLSLDEVRDIWRSTLDMGDLWGPFFRLMILTGQRRGEVSRLRWSEVDFSKCLVTKPGSETKNGRPHKTHLSHPAILELKQRESRRSESDFVFSADGSRPVANPSHAKKRLDELLPNDFEAWRIHDIRTAMATALANAGEAEAVVDRILNHSASGSAPSAVARVYNQSEQLPQRARALDRWADLVTKHQSKIVVLSGANRSV